MKINETIETIITKNSIYIPEYKKNPNHRISERVYIIDRNYRYPQPKEGFAVPFEDNEDDIYYDDL